MRPYISVTIPIYNEEENIPLLHKAVSDALGEMNIEYEVIFVNDGSRDGSAIVLDEIAKLDKRVKVIHFKKNFGQTAAMMAGFDYAAGDIIIPMDGDLQNDPKDIANLLVKIEEGYDVVSGWRKDRKDNAIKRNLPSKIANWLISKVSGVHLSDYGCSLKAYKKHVIKDVRLYGEMHRFIPIYASWEGARITEVPVLHHERKFGESKYGLNRVLKVVLDLMVVQFLAKFSKKPIYIFGGGGLLFLFCSFISLFWALGLKFFADTSLIQTPLPQMSSMFFIAGITSIMMGLLAEMITRTYYESQGKSVYSISYTKNIE